MSQENFENFVVSLLSECFDYRLFNFDPKKGLRETEFGVLVIKQVLIEEHFEFYN